MKILLINVNIGVGSVGRIVEDLYYGIVNSGNECKIAYGRINKSNISKKNLFKIDSLIEVYTHAFLSRITDKSGFYSTIGTKRLISFIEEYNPDIIHLHGNYGYYVNIKRLFEYLSHKDILIVNTLHSCWDFTGHCCHYTYANCNKWKNGCYKCPEKKSYPASYIKDNSKQNYIIKKELFTSIKNMIIVAPSNWMADMCKKSFLNKYPIKTIYNGIDLKSFKKVNVDLKKYNIDLNKKIILGVASSWSDRKGEKDFYDLANIVNDTYQIVMVGLKDKQLKKLPHNIIGIKRTDSKEELATLYSVATVLFNPTYEDNYPTVNLESFACGTPIITYNSGGSPELINKYDCGEVIKNKDYKELLKWCDYYYNKPLIVNEKQLEEISKENMLNKYLDVYSKLNCGRSSR